MCDNCTYQPASTLICLKSLMEFIYRFHLVLVIKSNSYAEIVVNIDLLAFLTVV